jgi:class 3 adenylate cyclase
MFTDIVGYTALTQRNESATMRLLEEHRKLIRPSFASHGGREIKSTGDGRQVALTDSELARCSARELGRQNVTYVTFIPLTLTDEGMRRAA